jgi:murein DD-endopeptidase MepM/ murein hydrolase activator NlpD
MSFTTPLAHPRYGIFGPGTLCQRSLHTVWKLDRSGFGLWILILCLSAFQILADENCGKSSSRETLIRISTEKKGTVTHLVVENVQAAEVTVTFEMELVNLRASVAFPHTLTLAAKSRTELFTLTPLDSSRGWSWTYTYYSTFGSTTADHDDSVVYMLPYGAGKSYRVSQGYNGDYSHFGADQYAVDWRMPVGTPVHAARGGTVVGVKNDSDLGGADSKYDWDANYVLIRHSDGTLGQYVHLMKGGSSLKVGQNVGAGQLIGLSGNTGHSTGPHLHFSVFKARDGKHRQTLPIRYQTAESFGITLVEGKVYKAGIPSTLAILAGKTHERNSSGEMLAASPSKEAAGAAGSHIGRSVGR